MKRGKSTGKPTKAEQARLDRLKAMPCLCCDANRKGSKYFATGLPVEVHHLVDMGTRALSGGHSATIPLCLFHHDHRGFYGNPDIAERAWGPWLKQRAKFRALYGTERELLAMVNERIGVE